MTDFLLELRSEEIPARMQAGARSELERLFRAEMDAAGVSLGEITVWSTPRRLALIARGLPEATEAVREEVKGPRTSAPPQALEGFLRKTGLAQDQLEDRGGVWFAVVEKPGRAVKAVLAEAIPAIVRAFAWPKSMRWGAASISAESLRWVRPLSGIVAIFGEELVACEVGGIASGYATLGHRFHCPGPITIGGAHDYAEKLRACHVIVDHEERAALIRDGARKAAAEAGLVLVADEGLVIENAGLTEWPVPLLGRFDEAFLDVPPEVIQLTARVNQKYFVCTEPSPLQGRGRSGEAAEGVGATRDFPHSPTLSPQGERELANAFVCVANIEAAGGGAAIADGNRKVLAARLADARFFLEQDRKTPLAEHAKKLARITFHEKLGTVADKVERVAKMARWLVEEGIIPPRNGEGDHAQHGGGAPSASQDVVGSANPTVPHHQPSAGPPPPVGEDRARLADLAEQAARLAKADLVTEMVGEFPELQGLMGGYYARAEGLPQEVADAIRDHYKPVGQGDEVPTAPVTVAVSLADKLDSICQFFSVGLRPTGSKDPFALRRAALGVIALVHSNNIRMSLILTTMRDLILFKAEESIEEGRARKAAIIEAVMDELGHEAAMGLLKGWAPTLKNVSLENQVREAVSDAFMTNLPISANVRDFILERLEIAVREDGVPADIVRAARSIQGGNEDDLVRLLARVNALQNFIATEDGANLLAAYKRAANILKKEDWPPSDRAPAKAAAKDQPSQLDPRLRGDAGDEDATENANGIPQTGEEDPLAQVDDPDLQPVIAAKMAERHQKELSYTREPAEDALTGALDSAAPRAAAAVEAEDFEGAMAALAGLRAPIDTFFDEVTVNDDDPAKRAARLDLLARFRDAVHQVADFSKIEG